MDLSLLTGNNQPPRQQNSAIEYTAQAVSPLVSGEVKMNIGWNSLTISALFNVAEIAFSEITAMKLADYTVTIKTDGADYALSRMGSWCQTFYDAVCGAYSSAVLRSMFIKDAPVITTTGNYRFAENGMNGWGSAPINVYGNCIAVLPPDLSARRIPLCFVNGMEKRDFELALRLDSGESYTFSKLGYDTEPFADSVSNQIRALHEKSAAAIRELDTSLTAAQASQITGLMPQGAAASFDQINKIAPSFVAALELKLANTRAAEYYAVYKELCGSGNIYAGFRKNEPRAGAGGSLPGISGNIAAAPGNPEARDAMFNLGSAYGNEAIVNAQDPYLLWFIAPSPNGQYAAVEFAEADAATFIYKTGGDFHGFARQLNRALEAISFRREIIRMTDEELRKPENADYYMAAKRTAPLQFVRSNIIGRIIHSSVDTWKCKLTELWRIV